jgi:threonine/homoserine/homoserine lactone efflux protein
LDVYAKATVKHDKADQSHALAIMLTIIAALGLAVLLSGLACSISCNGSGTLAIVILIVGTAGIVWGAVALIKSFSKKDKSKKQSRMR